MFTVKLLCALASCLTHFAVVSGAPTDPSPITTVHWGDGVVATSYTIAGEVAASLVRETAEELPGNTLTTTWWSGTLASGQTVPTALPLTTSAVVTVAGVASTVVFVEDVPPYGDPGMYVLVEGEQAEQAGPGLSSLIDEAIDDSWGGNNTLWSATASVGQVLTLPDQDKTITFTSVTSSYNVYGTQYAVVDPAAPTAS